MPDTGNEPKPLPVHTRKAESAFAFATEASVSDLAERVGLLEECAKSTENALDIVDEQFGAADELLEELFAYVEEDAPRVVQAASIISACFVSALLIAFGALVGLLLRRN
jgi:hypothetical protein